MKTIVSLFFASITILFGQDPPTEVARLETTNGKVYEQVKVKKIEPDGITIMHESGTAKVMFEVLSPEMQNAFGYNKAKAAEHRQAEVRSTMQALAAEKEATKKNAAKLTAAKSKQEDEAIRNRVIGMGRMIEVDGYQISNIGVLANIKVMKPVLAAVPGSTIKKDRKWVFDTKEDGVIRNAKGVEAGELVHFYPNGVKPWSEIRISWEGPAWRIGYIRYKTQQGLMRTCPLFTALEDDAVRFYKRHGFTQAAVDAVETAK